MGEFALGLLLGWISALLLGAAAAVLAYRRMVRLQERAKQAERLAELGTLTGGLAHEIKNPLSTVQLNLQLLREDLMPNHARLTTRLETAQRETGRLREILDDFLRYAGKLELEKKPVDLNEMLQEMVDFFAPQALASHVQLRLKPSEGPFVANVDEKLIKQAVLNLMLNGVQAMERNGGGELIVGASRHGNQAIIEVMDTGMGIEPAAAQRIFDAYYSTRKGGTGLGLAMTRRIVHEHGGRVELSSEVGKGSVFRLHLPL